MLSGHELPHSSKLQRTAYWRPGGDCGARRTQRTLSELRGWEGTAARWGMRWAEGVTDVTRRAGDAGETRDAEWLQALWENGFMQRNLRVWCRLRGVLRWGVRNVRRRRDEDCKDRDDNRLERIYMGAHVTNVTSEGLRTEAGRRGGTQGKTLAPTHFGIVAHRALGSSADPLALQALDSYSSPLRKIARR